MVNLAALVEYDGARFKGFQRQSAEKGPTVQGAIEAAIARIAGEPVVIEAAGRTDAGVHATGQVINFRVLARHDAATWRRALNALLPEDIAIRATCVVDEAFRARRSACSRSYRYRLVVDAVRAPMRERAAWRVEPPLDVGAMGVAAERLIGQHDFGAFGASPSVRRDADAHGHTVRTIFEARCRPAGSANDTESDAADEIECLFTANAFLTGMVRRLVGTLVLVGRGRLSAEGFGAILEARERSHRGPMAPAKGLCLTDVTYPAGMLHWEPLPAGAS